MQQLNFNIQISAPAEKVWHTLWNDTTYRQWTFAFHESSHAVSNWNLGDRVHFLSHDGCGVFSEIEQLEPNRLMVFKHLGVVKNHEELPADDDTQKWAGGREGYRLDESNGITTLHVTLDTVAEYAGYFGDVFPRALSIVKQLAEGTVQPLITVLAFIPRPAEKVWQLFTQPEHITRWYFASDDWHVPRASNDLRPGGNFCIRMEAKDGSVGFDFEGTYTEVIPFESIRFTMSDGREALVTFKNENGSTRIIERFQPEGDNPHDLQRNGWQAILSNLEKYAAAN